MVLDPEEPLDAFGRVKLRKEQAKLRRALFGAKRNGICGLCGKTLPVELLVAAHIKKRSRCTTEERRDYTNLVMAMCKLGCDDLFERGFVAVVDGKVVKTERISFTPDLATYVDLLLGREVPLWSTGSRPYFYWHSTYSFLG
jgi:hypothetical protein